MSRIGRVLLVLPLLGVAAVVSAAIRPATAPQPGPFGAELPHDTTPIPAMPFVRNDGQIDPSIAFHVPGSTAVGFATGAVRLGLGRGTAELSMIGAETAEPVGLGRTPTLVSFFRGARSQWHGGLPTFDTIGYPNAWPGIDVRFRQSGDRLKYELRLSAAADPSEIALSYGPGASLAIDLRGRLHATTPVGTLIDEAPSAYQLRDGRRVEVPVRYTTEGSRYGFDLGRYDRTKPLVIDPALVYSGFLGGSGYEGGFGVAVDEDGHAYVAGYTESSDFPATTLDTTIGGPQDAFVAKLTPDGSGLVYATFLGGAGNTEYGYGIAVDGAGNAYVTGQATAADFPTNVGPDMTFNGMDDVFVAKLDPTGTSLVYSGFIGGGQDDTGRALAIDTGGSVYLTGSTESADFPATTLDTTLGGLEDAFFAKVEPDGTGLFYAGLIGGSMSDEGYGMALGPDGDVYVAGRTESADLAGSAFPDTSYNGMGDGFLARLSPDGSTLRYVGYLGGTDSDFLYTLATDPSGNAYLGGITYSPDFPAVGGPDVTFNGPVSGTDAFVTKVNAAGTAFAYSGFVGGAMDDSAFGIAVDPGGSAYLVGRTRSADFPTADGPDTTFNEPGPDGVNDGDGFVAKVNPAGTGLTFSSFLGGSLYEYVNAVALDAGANTYVTGETESPDYPTTTGPDLSFNGGASISDAFVAKLATTERCKGRRVTLLGTEGADRIKGGSPDVIKALGGNDRVNAGGGNDIVCAGGGKDKVNGGGGKDVLLGEAGKDDLNGGGGSKDTCKGGPGKDDLGESCEKGK